VAAEPDETPVRRAAPLQAVVQDEPLQEAVQAAPLQEGLRDEP
jgi:hypothetical protein